MIQIFCNIVNHPAKHHHYFTCLPFIAPRLWCLLGILLPKLASVSPFPFLNFVVSPDCGRWGEDAAIVWTGPGNADDLCWIEDTLWSADLPGFPESLIFLGCEIASTNKNKCKQIKLISEWPQCLDTLIWKDETNKNNSTSRRPRKLVIAGMKKKSKRAEIIRRRKCFFSLLFLHRIIPSRFKLFLPLLLLLPKRN